MIEKEKYYERIFENNEHFTISRVYKSISDGYVLDNKNIERIVADSNFKLVIDKPTTPEYYNNENGSIYKFCNDQSLNSWESDIVKRIVRCRNKGE